MSIRIGQNFEVEVWTPDFEAEVWSIFCCLYLVEVTKLNFGQYLEGRFGQDFRDSDNDI